MEIKNAEFWEKAIEYASSDKVQGVTVVIDYGEEQRVMSTKGTVVEKRLVVAVKDLVGEMLESMCAVEDDDVGGDLI